MRIEKHAYQTLAVLVLLFLPLSACGSTAGLTSTLTATAVSATATATIPPPTATSTAVPIACGNLPTGPDQTGDLIFTTQNWGLEYPASRLPDTTPLQPYKLAGTPDNGFPGSFLSGPPANPYTSLGESGGLLSLIEVDVHNGSASKSHQLGCVGVKIASFVAYTGQFNEWQMCNDSYFTRPNTVPVYGGCGGAIGEDVYLQASFSANANVGASIYATSGPVFSQGGDKTLPVRLGPGQDLSIGIAVNLSLAGTYTLSTDVASDAGITAFSKATQPVIVGPVAHRWNGKACQTPAMNALIPTTVTNPPTYYICPKL